MKSDLPSLRRWTKDKHDTFEFKRYKCEAEKRRRLRARAEVFEAYGGAVCACCGESDPRFLTIDHINEDGADHRREIGAGGVNLCLWLKKHGFPPGFQILCWNCNSGRQWNGGVCPHKDNGFTFDRVNRLLSNLFNGAIYGEGTPRSEDRRADQDDPEEDNGKRVL